MHCCEISKVAIKPDENTISKLNQSLKEKWDLMPPSADFRDDLIRWRSLYLRCFTIDNIHFESTWSRYICNMLDAAFSLNTQELLKILCDIPVGSVEAETLFSFIRWIHSGLRNFIRGLSRYCCAWSCSYLIFKENMHFLTWPSSFIVDTGRKLNVSKTFNLHPVSTGFIILWYDDMFHFLLTLDLSHICTFCRSSSLRYRSGFLQNLNSTQLEAWNRSPGSIFTVL